MLARLSISCVQVMPEISSISEPLLLDSMVSVVFSSTRGAVPL